MSDLGDLGGTMFAAGVFMSVVLIMFHDPPSGYNCGTGDSWIPLGIWITVSAVGGLLMRFGGAS